MEQLEVQRCQRGLGEALSTGTSIQSWSGDFLVTGDL